MKKDFKNNLINKIKKEKIKPISKKYYFLKNILIYLFLWMSIFIWSISISIILWYLIEADWFLNHKLWLIKITTIFLPVFWIFFLIIWIIISYLNIKNTRKWYKFYIWQIILVNILISFLLWIIFYFSGISKNIENKIQNILPQYREYFVIDRISRMREVWQNEEAGLLLWQILSISNGSFELKDSNKKIWKIKLSKKTIIKHNLKLIKWERIKLMWKKIWNNIFNVYEIRPFYWNNPWCKK